MTENQKRLRELLDKQSRDRGRMSEISQLSELTPEVREEAKRIETGIADQELQIRACRMAVESEQEPTEAKDEQTDPETRERLELRSKANLGGFIAAALRGGNPGGAEAEYRAACGVQEGIPLDLWEADRPETRADTPTGTPSTVGVNLQPIQPYFFARAILPRLGVAMPSVESGTYASATISTALQAATRTAGDAIESSAAAMAVSTATPKRISARLSLRLEDLAAVGQANFEAALRQNLSMALSDKLDQEGLNGNGTAPNLSGLLTGLSYRDSTAPTAVVTFELFFAEIAEAIDGDWSEDLSDLVVLLGVDTYRAIIKLWLEADDSQSAYTTIKRLVQKVFTSKRMPAIASNVQDVLIMRNGHMATKAVCPTWGRVEIDDVYTDSAKGIKHFTVHAIVGDVIVVQPSGYVKTRYKVT